MERVYNIPLRKEFQKAPRYKKASKSIRAIKKFVSKHMKTENVIIGKYLNQEIWKNGPKNPPSKVSVKVVKEDDKVKVELVGAPEEPVKEEEPKKKGKKEKTTEVPKAEETPAELEKVKPTEKTPKTKEPVKEEKKKTKPKKKSEVPKAKDLVKKQETKKKEEKTKKIPTTKELKDKQ
jgi:large subunit ribosomal protein L31e